MHGSGTPLDQGASGADEPGQHAEQREHAPCLEASQRPVLSVSRAQAAAEEPRRRVRVEHPGLSTGADVDVERTDAGGVPPWRGLHQVPPSGDLEQVVPDPDGDRDSVHLYRRGVTAAAHGRGTQVQANQPVGLRRGSSCHDPIGSGKPTARVPFAGTRAAGAASRGFVFINADTLEEAQGYWDKLGTDATIVEPLAASAWNAGFGMLTDRFGVTWSVGVTSA